MKTFYKYNADKLMYEPVQKRSLMHKLVITTFVLFLLTVITSFTPDRHEIIHTPTEDQLIILDNTKEFSPEALKTAIKQLNLKHPDIVYAQAIQESGNFKSNIFIENRNMFGMKQAFVRVTTNKGTNRGHAVYDNWYASLLDYAMYQASYLRKFSRNEYFQYLQQNYAEDPSYVIRLKAIIAKNK